MAITVTEEMACFADIMDGIKPIVQDEFDNNRITGTDYANVFLQSLQQSLTLAFQKQTIDLGEQKIQAEIDGATAQKQLIDEQKTTIIDTRQKQIDTLVAETNLKNEQKNQFAKYGLVKQVEAFSSVASMTANAGVTPTGADAGATTANGGTTTTFWAEYFKAIKNLTL